METRLGNRELHSEKHDCRRFGRGLSLTQTGSEMSNFTLAEVFPPGEFVQDELEARGWTQGDLSAIIKRPMQAVNEIISGKRAITAETARALGEAFGTGPQLWMNLESQWRLSQSAQPDHGIARRAKLYSMAPVKEIIRREWVDLCDDENVFEARVLSFMGMSSIDETPRFQAAARMSSSYDALSASQVAWLRQAKSLAEHVDVRPFQREKFAAALMDIRDLAVEKSDVRRVPKFLAELGVRIVVIEHLHGTRIDGAAFWLDASNPVVALSMRYDRIDYFWHTLGHELGHICHGEGTDFYDEEMGEKDKLARQKPESERIADQFAAELLLPQGEIDDFIARVRPLYSQKKIVGFANRVGVHPGIVVGQLQFREEISFAHSRTLLEKVRQDLLSSTMIDGWGQSSPIR